MPTTDPSLKPIDQSQGAPITAVHQSKGETPSSWKNTLRESLLDWDKKGRSDFVEVTDERRRVMVTKINDYIHMTAINADYIASIAILPRLIRMLTVTNPAFAWDIDWERYTLRAIKNLSADSEWKVIDGWMNKMMAEITKLPMMLSGEHFDQHYPGHAYELLDQLGQIKLAIGDLTHAIHQRNPKISDLTFSVSNRVWSRLLCGLQRSVSLSVARKNGVIDAITRGMATGDEVTRLTVLLELERECFDFQRWHACDLEQSFLDTEVGNVDFDAGNILGHARSALRSAVWKRPRMEEKSSKPNEGQESSDPVALPEDKSSECAKDTFPPASASKLDMVKSWKPEDFVSAIRRRVVGQEVAVRAVALEMYLHLQENRRRGSLLVVGPTGCGKTLLAEAAATLAGFPFIHINAAALVPEGIVGQCLSDVCIAAITQADGNISTAERAVVMFDEIDKLTKVATGGEGSLYGTDILHQILRFIDGCQWHIGEHKTRDRKQIPNDFNTSRLLILFAGAWSSLREDAPKSVIGFQDQSHPDPLTLVNSTVSLAIKDLGMPLELVGRMSQSVHLTPLSQEALIAILTTESISPLCGLHDYLATKGSRIIIQDELLQKIAHTALKQGTGARGLVPLVRFYTDQIYWEKEIDNKVFYLTADGSLQVTSVSMSNSPSTFPEVA